jgi:hypothetical protein
MHRNLTSIPGVPHHSLPRSRREFLARSGAGFGAVAMAYLLNSATAKAAEQAHLRSPLAPRFPHYKATAKNVIFLFMEGGPSHIDTFDPKPILQKMAGQPLPDSIFRPVTAMGEVGSPLLASKRKWKQHGQSGIWVSDWLPHISTIVDEITVVRACMSDGLNHSGGVSQMNTGSILAGRPAMGAWATYGLGTENQNLPAFIVLTDSDGMPFNGPRDWGSGFMPAVYQGTRFHNGAVPITDLATPKGITPERQRAKLDLLENLNRRHADLRPDDTELEARIGSYELAFRMQAEAPGAIDLASESQATRDAYGMDNKTTETFGRNCLLARRLVERGVRFVQLYHGTTSRWDAHSGIEKNHSGNCAQMDKPVAALIKDLKQRGLLDETLVIWGGEFGRTPMSEKGDGRDHNPFGFTMWMAGGGVKGGQTLGATDDFGLHAVEDRLHVHDLHATWLHLMGMDHTKLVYFHKGRPERATMNEGEIYRKVTGV